MAYVQKFTDAKKARLEIRLSIEQKKTFKELAEKSDTSMNELVLNFIENYIKENNQR